MTQPPGNQVIVGKFTHPGTLSTDVVALTETRNKAIISMKSSKSFDNLLVQKKKLYFQDYDSLFLQGI